jgi:hypothetical protein
MKITHSSYNTPIKLKISLLNLPISIYRRVLVPQEVNMLQLHFIVQYAMGWQFSHLFQFSDLRERPSITVTLPWEEDDTYIYGRPIEQYKADEAELKSLFLIGRAARPFWYWYDFGDSWYHKITFQKPTKKDLAQFKGVPLCLDAFGACPPEDVGGAWGYDEFLQVVNNRKHPEYAEMREWAGLPLRGKYDEEYVDIESINLQLAEFYTSKMWNIPSDEYFGG